MSDEDDFPGEDLDPTAFEDPYAQRAIAFVALARFADTAVDQTAKDLTFTMMRKLSMSLRTPSTADLKIIGE